MELIKYKGEIMMAKMPETKTMAPGRLVGYDEKTKEYILHCGEHKREFRASIVVHPDEVKQ